MTHRSDHIPTEAIEAAREASWAKGWEQARQIGIKPNTKTRREENSRERMRAALEAALPHLRPEPSEAAARSEEASTIAGLIAKMTPVGFELNPDGTEDRERAAYVEGLREAHDIARARATAEPSEDEQLDTRIVAVLRSHHLYAPDDDAGVADNCQCGFDLTNDGEWENNPDRIDLEHAKHVAGLVRALSAHPAEETSEDFRGATCATCGAHFSAPGVEAGVELEVEHRGDSLHRVRCHSVPTDGEGQTDG